MHNKTQFSINIGLPSILLIFVILCLVSFGVLSLVSANSDLQLSKKILARTTNYYETCNEAEEMLADVQQQLSDAYLNCDSEEIYWDKIQTIPCSYSYKISELQELHISLRFIYPSDQNDVLYEIKAWQIITEDNIEYDESLHVIP